MTIPLFCESTAPKLKQIPKKSRAVGMETEAFSYIGSQKFCPLRRHVTEGNGGSGATAGLSSSASIENTAGQASSGTHK
jgi:hypothetical protein